MDLSSRLRTALDGPLPGLEAQLRLAPQPRVGWDPYHLPDGLRDAAGLLLLYPKDDAPHVLLTVRGGSLRHHTGQVSLPGGAVDPGETFEAAAVREAEEEVGLDGGSIEVIGRLTPLHIPVSGFLLHPVVGYAAIRPRLQPAEWEVARVLEVPLTRFVDGDALRNDRWVRERNGAQIEVDVPYFEIEGEKVWGATAMVLAEFLEIVGRIGVLDSAIS
jgi:8-oxo-dGTP pyrophosphatase MutT (NUDIX family)